MLRDTTIPALPIRHSPETALIVYTVLMIATTLAFCVTFLSRALPTIARLLGSPQQAPAPVAFHPIEEDDASSTADSPVGAVHG
jgi:hypothetical protein